MEIIYHLTNKDSSILASNLPAHHEFDSQSILNKIVQATCPIQNKKNRRGYFEYAHYNIYLCSFEEGVTNKILKRYFDACSFFIPNLIEAERVIKERENKNFRRLKHNLVTHNTNIIQELEKAFPIEKLPKGGHKQTSYIKDIITRKSEDTALSILKVIKSANLMKSDFDVYDMVNSKSPYLEFDFHNIHKIIVLILHPFWLDIVEKKITIDITDCQEFVFIDYKSISVVFSHLFDNLTKYIAPNTTLKIFFRPQNSQLYIYLEMVSLKITQKDLLYLFDEEYSGEFAEKIGKAGSGIGMNVVKKLLKMNNGDISVEVNTDEKCNTKILGIPFEKNKFIIILDRKEI